MILTNQKAVLTMILTNQKAVLPVEVLYTEGVDGDLSDPNLSTPLQCLRQLLKPCFVARDDFLTCLANQRTVLALIDQSECSITWRA